MSRSSLLWPVPLVLLACTFLLAQPGPPGQRAFLGVAVKPATDSGDGVAIEEVMPDSPAAKAGLKQGDVVTKLDGKDVPDVSDFLRAVGARKPGDALEVQLRRGDKEQTLKATLGQRPAPGGPAAPLPMLPGDLKELIRPAFLGVQVEDLTPELRKQLKVKAEVGAVVKEVAPNSPAAAAGLQRDDVITAVDGQAVKDPADLRAAVQKAGSGKDIMLHIQRGSEQKDVRASLKAGPGLGGVLPRAPDGKAPFDIESLWDQTGKVRQLERRIEALEKRLNALEKHEAPPKK
jgi:S1-C subfamily serine protease